MPSSLQPLEHLIRERLREREIPAVLDRLPKENGEHRYVVRVQLGVKLSIPEHIATRKDKQADIQAMTTLTDEAIESIGNVMQAASARLLGSSPAENETA